MDLRPGSEVNNRRNRYSPASPSSRIRGSKAPAALKRITLELGNNSGTIIEEDADVDKAVPRTVVSSFANSGQTCISLQRLYLHEKVAPAFTEKLLAATAALKIGNPLDRDCDVGPMIDEKEARRAEEWIREAVAQGAWVLTGGKGEGRILWPTVMTDVKPDMKVVCRETFAPLACLIPYPRFEDALEMLRFPLRPSGRDLHQRPPKSVCRDQAGRRRRHHGERHVHI
jgi:acyl-CoA reductase-like NAD-dependent aldehyde dehydrogenase